MKNILILLTLLLPFLFVTAITNAQDWANLGRYKEENATLKTIPSNGKRVVFMGNSITEGWGQQFPDFFKDESYINRGISGQTTAQMLVRFRPDVIDLKPSIVVILAGTNDIAGNTGPATLDEIFGNIVSMSELAKANNIKLILSSVLPAYDYPWKPGIEPVEKIVKLNEMIKKYADENEIIYLDYFSHMVDEKKGLNSLYSEDGVHPNKKGYLVMIPLVKKAIENALNNK